MTSNLYYNRPYRLWLQQPQQPKQWIHAQHFFPHDSMFCFQTSKENTDHGFTLTLYPQSTIHSDDPIPVGASVLLGVGYAKNTLPMFLKYDPKTQTIHSTPQKNQASLFFVFPATTTTTATETTDITTQTPVVFTIQPHPQSPGLAVFQPSQLPQQSQKQCVRVQSSPNRTVWKLDSYGKKLTGKAIFKMLLPFIILIAIAFIIFVALQIYRIKQWILVGKNIAKHGIKDTLQKTTV